MSAVTFDTLKFAEKLKSAGLTDEQAKAFPEAQKEVFAEALDTSLATKNDIFAVRQDISDVKSEIKLVKWMLGFLIGGMAFILLRLYFPLS